MHCHTECPQPCSRPPPPLDTPGHSWTSLSQSLEGSLLLSPGPWCAQVLFVPSKSLFPQSCVSSGSSSVGLFQEGLCRNKVCCTQSPCPCGGPLLTCTSAGDTQTIKGRPGSVSVGSSDVHKVLFEPSEHLWQVWGLILNMILPLLPSCWASPLPLDVGCLF